MRGHWICSRCTHEWEANIYTRAVGSGCPQCAKIISKPEEELSDFFTTKQLNFTRNTRRIIAPHEVDFYFPDQKIAVEYNGVLWHSEKYKPDHNYHYNKWKACADQGVQLIMIWEDDWLRNPELVKTMLSHKLGVSDQPRVYARELKVDEEVYREEARAFLDENHIQGNAYGSLRIGLRDEGERLVAVSVFKKTSEGWYLVRYAASARVVGGLGKILKRVDGVVTTFADRTVSDGGLYERLGFQVNSVLPPDYAYLYHKQRTPKSNFRIQRFKNDPGLHFEEGLSERELAMLNGAYRIWDCGKAKYVREV